MTPETVDISEEEEAEAEEVDEKDEVGGGEDDPEEEEDDEEEVEVEPTPPPRRSLKRTAPASVSEPEDGPSKKAKSSGVARKNPGLSSAPKESKSTRSLVSPSSSSFIMIFISYFL